MSPILAGKFSFFEILATPFGLALITITILAILIRRWNEDR